MSKVFNYLKYIKYSISNQKIERSFNYKKYKEMLNRNISFQNAYSGKRCFVLGNGPSLKTLDFSLLEKEIVFTVNQLPRNPQFDKLKTNFHFWADSRFFELDENNEEDQELLDVMKMVAHDGNNPFVFYELDAIDMIKKYRLDEILNIYYFSLQPYDFATFVQKKAIDITKPMPNNPTVIHTIIAMAVDMGFSEIYLLGCDCTGFVNMPNARLKKADTAEYNYKISENEKKRMEKVALQTSVRDELMSYVKLFDRYSLLLDYCNKHNVKLYNATKNSLLDSVPKVNLSDIL